MTWLISVEHNILLLFKESILGFLPVKKVQLGFGLEAWLPSYEYFRARICGVIIIRLAQVHSISMLDLADAGDLPLFHNPAISRRLPAEGIQAVLEELAAHGNLEWTDKAHRRGHVFWRAPAQLGAEIYK